MIDELICYLAISCCNKFSIFFVFIREPGQNVRCHKFGGPCICKFKQHVYHNNFEAVFHVQFATPSIPTVYKLCPY